MLTVVVTEPAFQDIDETLHWLEERSAQGAANWYARYRSAIEMVRDNGRSFGLAPETGNYDESIHELTFSTRYGNAYRVLYIIRDETAFVLRVRGTGQTLLPHDDIIFPE